MNTKHRVFLLASFVAFILFALPYMIHGSNAPVLMSYYGISASQQGLIVTMQSLGGIGASLFFALRGERYNKIHVLALGLIVICIGSAVIGLVPVYSALICIVIGVGAGVACIDVMMNGVISDIYPTQVNTLLPVVHAFFVLGAMITPIFVTQVATPENPVSFAYPYRIISILAIVIFVFYFISGQRILPDTPYKDLEAMKKRVSENPAEVFKTKKAWLFFVAAILYITFQHGTNMWMPTYAIEEAGVDFRTAGLTVTAFFAPALPMRFLTPLLLRKIPKYLFYSVFGWVAAVCMMGAILTSSVPLMFFFIVAAGFLQGSIIVVLIIMCTEAFPDRTASASSIAILAVGVAIVTAPLWMGRLSETTGFQIPMLLICCSLAASSLIIFLQGRASKRAA